MRVSIIVRGKPLHSALSDISSCGARNIKSFPRLGQVVCDLDESGIRALEARGYRVKKLGRIRTMQVERATVPVWGGSQISLASLFDAFRNFMSPPLTGEGNTVVLMDTGVRKTHISLRNKVVLEENFTTSSTADDLFDHGTGVAWIVCGGEVGTGEEAGVAPGSRLWNFKVMGDDGSGEIEWFFNALDKVASLHQEAETKGLPSTDPMHPNVVNCSFGVEDDGDPENPVRVAIEEFRKENPGILIVAAVGNKPDFTKPALPAASPVVWAIGGADFLPPPYAPAEYSVEGPAVDGTPKPDFVFYSTQVLTASARADDAFKPRAGTSFAAPAIAGAHGLMWEGGRRLVEAGRAPISGYEEMTYEDWKHFVAMICKKPPGYPPGWDPKLGYGMPTGDLAQKLFEQAISPLTAVGEFLPLMMLLTLVRLL